MSRIFTLSIDLDRLAEVTAGTAVPSGAGPAAERSIVRQLLAAAAERCTVEHAGHTQSLFARDADQEDHRVGSWRIPPDGGDPPPPDDEGAFTHAVHLVLWNDQLTWRDLMALTAECVADEDNPRLALADNLKAKAEQCHEWMSQELAGAGSGQAWAWPTILAQFAFDAIREVDWLALADQLIEDHEESA